MLEWEGFTGNDERVRYMKKVGNELISLMEELSQVSTNGEAHVRVNENLADPEEFKQLFNYFSKGTILERVDLRVESFETKINCVCGHEEAVGQDHNGYSECPECGRIADVDDRGHQLVKPNPEKAKPRAEIKF